MKQKTVLLSVGLRGYNIYSEIRGDFADYVTLMKVCFWHNLIHTNRVVTSNKLAYIRVSEWVTKVVQFGRVLRPHVSKVNWFMGNNDRSFWQMHPSSSMRECCSNNSECSLEAETKRWSLKMNKNQCYPFIVAVSAIKSTPYKSLLLQTSIQPIIVTFTWTFTGQKYWFHTNLSIHSIHTTKHVSNVCDVQCSEW